MFIGAISSGFFTVDSIGDRIVLVCLLISGGNSAVRPAVSRSKCSQAVNLYQIDDYYKLIIEKERRRDRSVKD